MIVNPPAFLTESEARSVIEEEVKKAGLAFPEWKAPPELKDVELPITDLYGARKGKNLPGFPKSKKGILRLTGWQPEKRIGYRFVSRELVKEWNDSISEMESRGIISSSVSDFNMLETAQALQKSLSEREGEETLAVFYDPVVALERLTKNCSRKK